MSKGLEALERIRKIRVNGGFDTIDYFPVHKKDLDIIETALKRQDRIEITAIDIEQDNKELCKENKKLKKALKEKEKDEKKLKALEIIKEKSVDVGFLQFLKSCSNERYNNYIIEHAWTKNTKKLTQEEYDLLKEVLEW